MGYRRIVVGTYINGMTAALVFADPIAWTVVVVAFASACTEPAASGPSPVDPPTELEPTGPVTQVWSTEVHRRDGFGFGITPQPLDGGERIAVLHDGETANWLYHIDPECGAILDSFPVSDPTLGTGSVFQTIGANIRLGDDYLAQIDGWPFRFSLVDGQVDWVYPARYYSGIVCEGRLYAGRSVDRTEQPMVDVIDVATGQLIDSIGAPAGYSNEGVEFHGYSAVRPFPLPTTGEPALAATLAISTRLTEVGRHKYIYVAFRLSDKGELWQRSGRGTFAASHPPAFFANTLIHGRSDTLLGFDASTGEEKWSYYPYELPLPVEPETTIVPGTQPGGNAFTGAPMIVDEQTGILYAGNRNHYQFAVDAATGAEVWRGGGGRGTYASTFVDLGAGLLSVASPVGSRMYILNKHTGEILATVFPDTNTGLFQTAFYYDAERNLLVGYDGARVTGWRVNFEVPGE